MDIYLSFKTPKTYIELQKHIINGKAPALSKLIYNEDNTQSIYQFDLNDYDFNCYGFPSLSQSTMSDEKYVWFKKVEPRIIGIDDGKGDFIQFNF